MNQDLRAYPKVEDIVLELPDAEEYLAVLARIGKGKYPQLAPILGNIERSSDGKRDSTELDSSLVADIIGYNDYSLVCLLEREWLDDDGVDEFEVLISSLESRAFFAGIGSIFIYGAGTCGLGDFLASKPQFSAVTCADLSWLALYFGKSVIEGRLELLPRAFREMRVFYEPDCERKRLCTSSRPSRLRRPLSGGNGKISYVVRNVFHNGSPIAAEMICAPFLLDCFGGERMKTALIRLCQQTSVGQSLAIMVTCRGDNARLERNPAVILELLERCGFEIGWLDLVALPYSFSRHDHAYVRTTYNTFVVRAVKRDSIKAANLALVSRLRREDAIPESAEAEAYCLRRGKSVIVLGESEVSILRLCQKTIHYDVLLRTLAGRFGLDRIESAVATLTARALVDLGLR